ncbi:MAG: VapC toxin family PIN domain ribonuclease [Burkholderiaceae bacterium]|nr:VapC toxin family PIN domain ribonuclease [Burkholderiaceae bacterium]
MKVTLDSNALVRLATQDDPGQAAAAWQALRHATLIAVPTPALFGLVWVLLRGFRCAPDQVAHALRVLLQTRHVVCDTAAVLAGLALLEGGDFADGAIARQGAALGGNEFLSFDRQAVTLLQRHKHKARLLAA